MHYHRRGLRRRRNTYQWECTLTHKDPITGEAVTTYHTVKGKTKRQAEKERDDLILKLAREGTAAVSSATLRDFADSFIDYKKKAVSWSVQPWMDTVSRHVCFVATWETCASAISPSPL